MKVSASYKRNQFVNKSKFIYLSVLIDQDNISRELGMQSTHANHHQHRTDQNLHHSTLLSHQNYRRASLILLSNLISVLESHESHSRSIFAERVDSLTNIETVLATPQVALSFCSIKQSCL